MSHLSTVELMMVACGHASDELRAAANEHVQVCAQCRADLARFTDMATEAAAAPDPDEEPELPAWVEGLLKAHDEVSVCGDIPHSDIENVACRKSTQESDPEVYEAVFRHIVRCDRCKQVFNALRHQLEEEGTD